MQLKIEEIIRATGGRCLNPEKIGDTLIEAITTDSRKISECSLFVPLKGERFDGHTFISSISKQGAIATLTEKEIVEDQNLIHIFVADTGKALLDLASYYRKSHDIKVVGITGSVGKTTTKDMIAAVLSKKFSVLKTQGNFNNEIGLPLTVFGLDTTHQVAVLEMGMNHFNEIHRLTMVAQPDIAIITNIGTSHIENLGSRDGILQAKLEILDGLKEDGVFMVNGCDPYLLKSKDKVAQTTTYGIGEGYDYGALEISTQDHTTYAKIYTPTEQYSIEIPALGEHMVMNSLVAIAVAEQMHLTKEEIIEGLLAYTPSKMRMNIVKYASTITVMDDAYNASPDSMKASLKVLSDYQTQGRRIAVLGDMFEMGDFGPGLHEEVGAYVEHLAIDRLYCIGELSKFIAEAAKKHKRAGLEINHYKDKQDFIDTIDVDLQPEDVILVKASRGMKFEEIVEAIGKVKYND